MSSNDPIEGVSGVSSVNPYDPNNYTIGGYEVHDNDPTIKGMASSLDMTDAETKKFVNNLVNYISDQNKHESDEAIQSMKEQTKELTQA